MGDIALQWGTGDADLAIVDDDLASDEGLKTAVILSLFLDRRAEDDDVLPADDGDRRGWWGDEFAEVPGDRIGSRLWLLDRSKRTPGVAQLTEQYAREALAWMIEDRVTDRIDVVVEVTDELRAMEVSIWRPGAKDPVTFRFAHVWEGEAAAARDVGPANLPPTAGFTVAISGLEVTPSSFASDSDGSLASSIYAWGDGTSSAGPSHTYVAGGTYTIVQTVTDDDGATDTASVEVEVNEAPTASFTVEIDGTVATFTDASTDPEGPLAAWSLDPGDGSAALTGPGPWVHDYGVAGDFTAELTVTDADGATDVHSEVVTTARETIAVSLLTSGTSPTDGTSVSTASVSPTDGADLLACVVAGKSGGITATPTCTGNGQTWTLIEDTACGGGSGADVHLYVFHAKASSPSAGAVTFDFGAETVESFTWHVVECDGTSASAIVQTTTGTGTSSPLVGTLAALEHASNAHVAFAAERGTATGWVADVDFAEIAEQSQSGYNQGSYSQWAVGQVECSTEPPAAANGAGIISIEVQSSGAP